VKRHKSFHVLSTALLHVRAGRRASWQRCDASDYARAPFAMRTTALSDESSVRREVEKLAGLRRIRLRTGAFCNPGAAAAALRLSAADVRAHFETGGHTCWDDHDIIGAKQRGVLHLSEARHSKAVLAGPRPKTTESPAVNEATTGAVPEQRRFS